MTTNDQKTIYLYVISDSAGETAARLAHAVMAQYPDVDINLARNIMIKTEEKLLEALNSAREENAMILYTIINEHLSEIAGEFCEKYDLFHVDLLSSCINELQKRSGIKPHRRAGAMHVLNENYFKRIEAIEFAVQYDDGKDPRGFLDADVVLIGVSRTSKTPLSQFLANKNLKVANLPLVPNTDVPDEIWQVNPNKVVGLMNDAEVLNNFRKERMRAYGLDVDNAYSDMENIEEELRYAREIYAKIGCFVINVAQRSIEETASIIMNELKLEDHGYND